ncbi:MAG: methyltransferase domain-containing protein [Polaribacter sp.]
MECLLCLSKNTTKNKVSTREEIIKIWKPFYNVEKIFKEEAVYNYKCNNCNLLFFDPKYAGDDDFYSELGKQTWYYEHPGKTEYDYVQQFFKSGFKVLDVGSGIGILKDKTKAEIDYTGLELSTQAVKIATEKGLNVKKETIQEHAENNEEVYDIVVSFQVLEHLTETKTFLESIKKVLKKGGKFVVAMPNNESFISRHPNYTFNLPPHHTILWKKKQLEKLAEIYELEVVKIHNEPLQESHRKSAFYASKYWFINSLIFRKIKLIDQSKTHFRINRFINKFDKLLSTSFFKWILKSKIKDGQSIIVVYKKF